MIYNYTYILLFSSPDKPGITLLTAEICYRIVKERLLETLIHDILEEVALETLSMTHLTMDLAIAADDSLDSII